MEAVFHDDELDDFFLNIFGHKQVSKPKKTKAFLSQPCFFLGGGSSVPLFSCCLKV